MVTAMATITQTGPAVAVDFGDGAIVVVCPEADLTALCMSEVGASVGVTNTPAHWDYVEAGGVCMWVFEKGDVL